MAEKDEGVEDRYLGGRLFRKMGDGQIVEVGADGSVDHEFVVGGHAFDSQSASFTSMTSARRKLEESIEAMHEPSSSGEGMAEPAELTMQDRMREYLNKDKASDPRLQGSHGELHFNFGDKRKSVMDNTPTTPNAMGGMHGLGGGHGMGGSAGGLGSAKVDPLRKMLDNQKPTSFAGHQEKVKAAYGISKTSRPKGRYRH